MNQTIAIVDYEQNGNCEHCGRVLKHCIRISDGRIVGATCFDKIITKPRTYRGKKYRIGAENVIRYARIVAKYNAEAMQSRFGISPHMLVFEAA